ncbi:methyl-accepting chemotaxis protein [Agarivorans sp. OAG1]|uniref:HAMP domain-containing methyl-accepting chemotaxis protein n=1 Tax=Agarivorans sp. OAG1 TaxID=3082387 RepID=UPI002B31709F|nr:methyl-accepting chemotaxis protein [Agarivorans sp. OAG1]
MSISNKLLSAFGFVAILMFCSAVIVFIQLDKIAQKERQIVEVSVPVVAQSKEIERHLQQSLSALRAYLIHGADKQRAEHFQSLFEQSWLNIDLAVEQIQLLSDIAVPEQTLTSFLALKELQQQIIKISNSEDNLPAHALLLFDIAPLAEEAMNQVSSAVTEEISQPGLYSPKKRVRLLADMSEARNELANALTSLRSFIITGDKYEQEKYQEYFARHKQRVADVEAANNLFTEEQARLWQQFVELVDIFVPLVDEMFVIRAAPDWNIANHRMANEVIPLVADIELQLNDWNMQQQNVLVSHQQELERLGEQVVLVVFAGAAIAALLGGLVVLWLTRQIKSNLALVNQRAMQIANGNLSQPALKVSAKDEVGQLTGSINAMAEQLKGLITEVNQTAADVSQSSVKAFDKSSGIGTALDEQRSKVDSAATAIEEMSVAAREIAQNTSQAADHARDCGDVASQGGQVVTDTISIMQKIEGSVSDSNQHIAKLNLAGEEVEKITDVIAGIAEQTNLLALNAAIEAARAGEQGRGFAVVADEVRSLASRTSQSTEEIARIINQIRSLTEAANQSMSKSTELVSSGRNVVNKAGDALHQVIDTTQGVTEMVTAIAAATEEQSAVASDVAATLETIALIAQDSVSEAQSSVNDAKSLEEKSNQLKQQIQRFVL